jgi:hypothetical protein
MSNTYKYVYLPNPPRVWSRVNTICTYDISTNNVNPLYFNRIQEINKGNVLQYKKNSSQITKQQKYSQIAKGLWTNRTKTWATQSDLYTNPNTLSLKRVGFTEIIRDDINNPFNCPNFNTFKDGGILLCNSYENPCTGKIIKKTYQSNYFPTSDSDVPGPIKLLYWDPRTQTWFPKVRRTMNNSTDKWPINYKLFTSALKPDTPILTYEKIGNNIKLSWSVKTSECIPITNFNIYQNINGGDFSILVNVNSSVNNYTIDNLIIGKDYSYYIVALSTKYSSLESNIVSITL